MDGVCYLNNEKKESMNFSLQNHHTNKLMNDLIYKYKTVNEHLYEALSKNKIYAPNRKTLNDPFDEIFYVKESGRSTKYQSLINIVKKVYKYKFEKEDNNTLAEFFRENKINLVDFIEQYGEDIDPESYLRYISDSYGVVALTPLINSNLMWAHYGNAHKGICIEYKYDEVSFSKKHKDSLFEINYIEKFPSFNLKEYLGENIVEFFNFKSIEWEYEKEIRFITPNGNSLVELDLRINAIYFGINIEEISVKKIYEILGDSVEYYKSIKKNEEFTILSVKVDIEDFIESFKKKV